MGRFLVARIVIKVFRSYFARNCLNVPNKKQMPTKNQTQLAAMCQVPIAFKEKNKGEMYKPRAKQIMAIVGNANFKSGMLPIKPAPENE